MNQQEAVEGVYSSIETCCMFPEEQSSETAVYDPATDPNKSLSKIHPGGLPLFLTRPADDMMGLSVVDLLLHPDIDLDLSGIFDSCHCAGSQRLTVLRENCRMFMEHPRFTSVAQPSRGGGGAKPGRGRRNGKKSHGGGGGGGATVSFLLGASGFREGLEIVQHAIAFGLADALPDGPHLEQLTIKKIKTLKDSVRKVVKMAHSNPIAQVWEEFLANRDATKKRLREALGLESECPHPVTALGGGLSPSAIGLPWTSLSHLSLSLEPFFFVCFPFFSSLCSPEVQAVVCCVARPDPGYSGAPEEPGSH